MPEPIKDPDELPVVDTSKPNIARVYDYWLGGKDNFEADRVLAERLMALYPPLPQRARENRLFLGRAVRALARKGIRQFLDIGAGIPTGQNTHEAAQAAGSGTRVTYVDNDPVVLTHARALLRGDGVTAIGGDLADPAAILGNPDLGLALDEPVCVVLACVLHFFDAPAARKITGTFADALAPGSYLVVSVGAGDEQTGGAIVREYTAATLYNHSTAQVAGFLSAFGLIEPPGVTDACDWEPEEATSARPREHRSGRILAGVARKPLDRF